MVLMVICWRYGMPFDPDGWVSTLVNDDWLNWMLFLALMIMRLALVIVYFLVMNSKRCTSNYHTFSSFNIVFTLKHCYFITLCNFTIIDAPILVLPSPFAIHLLLFVTRKYTIISGNLKLINAKIYSFYSIDIH